MAPVKFMFSRHGLVKVALERDDSYADKLEHLIEKMIDAGAEDFAESVPEEGDAEISVSGLASLTYPRLPNLPIVHL